MADLDVLLRLSNPGVAGGWLEAGCAAPYTISGDARETVGQTWRRTVAESVHLPGNYLVSAVPDMVEENVSVWVEGANHGLMMFWLEVLTATLSQPVYTVEWQVTKDAVGFKETWQCQVADWRVATGREFLHSRICKVEATLPRLPDRTLEGI